jgi:hypothetical protein
MITSTKTALLFFVVLAMLAAWKAVDTFIEPDRQVASARLPEIVIKNPVTEPQRQVPRPVPLTRQLQAGDSIEEKLKALSASGNPAQSLEAFRLIRECLKLERDKELPDTEVKIIKHATGSDELEFVTHKATDQKLHAVRKSCSTMTGRTRSDRYQFLEHALDHHVGGALALYIEEGPQGDANALKDRPTDPLVIEWRNRAFERLEEGIHLGYPDALLYAPAGLYKLGREQSATDSYTLYLATNKVYGAINSGEELYSKNILDGRSQTLSQQQKNDAELRANRIFLEWKKRK